MDVNLVSNGLPGVQRGSFVIRPRHPTFCRATQLTRLARLGAVQSVLRSRYPDMAGEPGQPGLTTAFNCISAGLLDAYRGPMEG